MKKNIIFILAFHSFYILAQVPDTKNKYEVQKLIKSEENKLSQIKAKEISILRQIEKLQKEIFKNDTEIAKIKFSTKATSLQIDTLKSELQETEETVRKLEEQFAIVANTVNKLYGNSNIYFLESILNSGSFDNLNRNLKLSEIFINTYFTLFKNLINANSLRKRKLTQISQSSKKLNELDTKQSYVLANVKLKKKELITLLRQIESEKILHLKLLEELKVAEQKLDNALDGLTDTKVDLTGLDQIKEMLPLPLDGVIVQKYGRQVNTRFKTIHFNKGITISSPKISQVKAVYDGVIVFSNWFKGYGNLVIINHGNNYYSLYAKAEKILLQKGDHVKKNDIIALADKDQNDQYQLYFELRHKKRTLDPLEWLKK